MDDYVKCTCGEDKQFCPDCYKNAVIALRVRNRIIEDVLKEMVDSRVPYVEYYVDLAEDTLAEGEKQNGTD